MGEVRRRRRRGEVRCETSKALPRRLVARRLRLSVGVGRVDRAMARRTGTSCSVPVCRSLSSRRPVQSQVPQPERQVIRRDRLLLWLLTVTAVPAGELLTRGLRRRHRHETGLGEVGVSERRRGRIGRLEAERVGTGVRRRRRIDELASVRRRTSGTRCSAGRSGVGVGEGTARSEGRVVVESVGSVGEVGGGEEARPRRSAKDVGHCGGRRRSKVGG
jgi:hypothetical protein